MIEHEFRIESGGETVRGVLWTPGGAVARPLVLAGHGLAMHKRALFPQDIAERLTSGFGFCVAAIDAPEHGARRSVDGIEAIGGAWSAHWASHGASIVARDHAAVIDSLGARPEIDADRVGYWGLSLATQYGIGVIAAEPRIRAAVLGLFSLADPGRLMRRYAPRVGCPVFFIRQHDDEIHPADRVQMLFDLLASPEKTLRSSSGRHRDVPEAVFDEACAFLKSRLEAKD